MHKSPNSWLLDAGCGTGRLLPEFEKSFSHILAVDSDPNQIEKAQKLAAEKKFEEKVVFKISLTEELDWEKESIDVVLCSHVIQHVNTESVSKILEKFHFLLKSQGLLFIMTTFSGNKPDYYVKGCLKGSESIEKKISKKEFNSLIYNEQNILPLHFFSVQTLTSLFSSSGFSLLSYKPFHGIGKSVLLNETGKRNRPTSTRGRLGSGYGRDVLVVGKK